MNLTRLAHPPNPNDSYYAKDFMAWQKAVYTWMEDVKAQIEADSTVNTQPVGPLVVSTYTSVTTVTGTDALSNFVATLVAKLQAAGITAPTAQRS